MTRQISLLIVLCALVGAPSASAQLGGLPLPPVPDIGDVAEQTRNLGQAADHPLQDVRRLAARDLLRTHRRVLEADPNGHPILRSQILGLGTSEAALANARAAGFEVVRTDAIDDASALITLRTPAGMSTRRALRRLRDDDPEGVYDFDHLYLQSGAAVTRTLAQASAARSSPRIGLVDSGVAASVRAVAARQAFASATPVVAEHGTAIASLLSEAAPGARIYAADIYGGEPTGGASSALARALAWLARENTPVINVSLVGPRNRIVEAIVARLTARGFVLVAAVGNDGPAAAPLFPAAYAGVIGVTGVDARDRALIEAGRGAHVDFAARAVHGRARGTSYAAPIVAARLALRLPTPNAQAAREAIGALQDEARDLGARGRDDVYGYGVIEIR